MEKQVFSNWYEEVFIPYIEGEEGFEDVDPVAELEHLLVGKGINVEAE